MNKCLILNGYREMDIWIYDMIWYDIFINCNWVVNRWQ